jgi:hypothetical protein
MKISVALLLSSAISSSVLTSVAAGGCVTGATSDRDQCLCGCLRSGYNCDGSNNLELEADLEAACTNRKIGGGGPCYWDPFAERTDNSSCSASCPLTNFCGGGDGPEEPPTNNCGDTPDCDATSRQDCNKECCKYAKVQGVWTCGPKV